MLDQPDAIIHQPIRLKIMAALKALAPGAKMEFVRLRALVDATEGNLGAHLGTLEKAEYISVEKDFDGKKPRTRVSLTRAGRRAFETYISYLRDILES